MKKILSALKRNKKKVIIISVVLIVAIVLFIAVYQIFRYLTPDRKSSVYGDRCELTESIVISETRKKEIKAAVAGYEGMSLSTINIKCNLIDIIVIVKDDTEVAKVKEMSKALIEVFSDEELKYYDLGLYVDSDKAESENYPMIGTKHKTNNGEAKNNFVW